MLLAVCGVLFGLVSPMVRLIISGQLPWTAVPVAIPSALVGSGIGFVFGLFHIRRGLGAGMGAVAGLAVGALAGWLLVMPERQFFELLGIAATGMVVLLAIGVSVAVSRTGRNNTES